MSILDQASQILNDYAATVCGRPNFLGTVRDCERQPDGTMRFRLRASFVGTPITHTFVAPARLVGAILACGDRPLWITTLRDVTTRYMRVGNICPGVGGFACIAPPPR